MEEQIAAEKTSTQRWRGLARLDELSDVPQRRRTTTRNGWGWSESVRRVRDGANSQTAEELFPE